MRIFVILGIASVALFSCKGTSGTAPITTKTDSISYAIGRDIASNFQKTTTQLSPESFLEGLKESTKDNKSLSDGDIQKLLMVYQQELQQRMMQKQLQQQQQGGGASRNMSKSNVAQGQDAPEIDLQTPDGKNLKLSDLRGKYVLVDFWASWCKPCRLENPNVVKVYQKYKDKGFEILGVSLDRDRNRWLQAIAADNLTWKHVSDLKYFNSAAAVTYGVQAIPFTVLVDKEGKIIAQNLRGQSLYSKLEEIFGA